MHAVTGAGRLIAGRYRLHDPIGRGAMGIVWHGRDELLDRDVAVKEVQISAHAAPADAEVIYQRTLREAKTAARLSHPSVVKVFDVVEEGGSPWIIMELIEARSLDRVITEDGPLPPDKAADLGQSLVSALATAHAAGVLHRDVKPSNVLVTKDGRAVLTDFGIATFAEDLSITQAGMVVGTPGFTAPERIRGDIATPASDLWSVGATLYAAVEGRGPFERVGGSSVISAGVAIEDAPRAPSAGPLAPVIDALLSRDPGTRPDATTAGRLLADAATEARTGPRPLSGWLPDASHPAEPKASAAPAAGDLLSPDSGFLDPPDYEVLQIPPADDSSRGSGENVAAAAVVAADSGPGSEGKPGIADPSSGPALWGPVKDPQPQSQPGAPSGPGHDGAGAGGSGGSDGSGPGGGDKPSSQRPRRSSRAWRLMVAAVGIAAIAVAAVIGWNIFQHSGPASALGSSVPPSQIRGHSGLASHAGTTSARKSKSGSHRGGSGSTSPSGSGQSHTPGASPHASGQPGPGPTQSHGGPSHGPNPSSGPSSPSATASPSASTTPSPTPSPSPSPSPGVTLPTGWKWHRFPATQMYTVAGFKIGMPDAWTQSVSGSIAYLVQSAHNYHLVVNLNYWVFAKPLRQAQYLKNNAAVAHPYGFTVLVLAAIGFKSVGGYRAASAAELKYKWLNATTGKSFTEEVILVTLPTSAGVQPYQFSTWSPTSVFGSAWGVVRKAFPTFRPLPG